MLDATRDRAVLMVVVAIAVAVTGVGCSKRGTTSEACTDIAGAACQQCRYTATHRFCDAKSIAPQVSDNSTVNGQKGCCGFNDPKLRAQCESILRCIRTTGCSAGNNPGPCLCADVDPVSCARSGNQHAGVCAAEYRAATADGTPASIIAVFGDPRSPIGVANNTLTCDFDAGCPCGQKK